MNNFHYSMSLTNTLYGINIPEEEWEEIALVGWNLIGNKRTKIYRYKVCMDDCGDNSIELPCNCDLLEAVTTGWEDWGHVTNDTPNGDLNSAVTEQYIEHRKAFHDSLYQSGKLLKYERVGDTIYLDRPYSEVNILYRGLVLDDDGLPELTDKEALAIATYCAWIIKYKEGLMTNNANIILFANTLKLQWNVLVNQARTDEYLSLNDWNNILDAKVNWDRKVFRKSWKPYK